MQNADRNKWLKYMFMSTSEDLSPYLPETHLLTEESLFDLLKKYGSVIVKPVKGSRGRDVIQVTSFGENRYALHCDKKQLTIQGKKELSQYFEKRSDHEAYVVQRKISRATIHHRPFDMRVIVQRKKYSDQWEVTAKIAKIPGKGYIVSNISRSNGTLLSVPNALQKSTINHLSTKKLESQIDQVAILTAQILEQFFYNHRIYGLDMAVDQNGHVWVIEANLYPLMSHFRKWKDKTMYRRIMAYKQG